MPDASIVPDPCRAKRGIALHTHRVMAGLTRSVRSTFALGMFAAFLTMPQPAFAEEWVDQRVVGPFVCQANFRLAEYDTLLGELAGIQAELARVLAINPGNERVQLYLLSDNASYRRFLAQRFPQVPYRQALYIRSGGQATVVAYRSPELAVDLRHECTHALLHAGLSMVPLWLDEGLAEYFEVPAAKRALRNPHHNAIKWRMRLLRVPRLEVLEAKHSLEDMGAAEYRDSWAFTHFLLHGPPEARAELLRYLGDIRAGTPPGKLSDRLRPAFPDLQGSLVEHFKTLK